MYYRCVGEAASVGSASVVSCVDESGSDEPVDRTRTVC